MWTQQKGTQAWCDVLGGRERHCTDSWGAYWPWESLAALLVHVRLWQTTVRIPVEVRMRNFLVSEKFNRILYRRRCASLIGPTHPLIECTLAGGERIGDSARQFLPPILCALKRQISC